MKSIRLILLIVIAITHTFVVLRVNWNESVLSVNNLNCLFGIVMCSILFYIVMTQTNRLINADKRLYPKILLICLLGGFGLMCTFLITIAHSNHSGFDMMNYSGFFASAFLCIGCISVMWQRIRENMSNDKIETQ